MKMNATIKRYLVAAIVFGVLSFLSILMLFFYGVFNIFGGGYVYVEIILIVVSVVLSSTTFIMIKSIVDNRKNINQLEMENMYVLGHKTGFYNFETFKTRASAMSRSIRFNKYRKYIIAFTGTSARVTGNSSRNDMIASFNYYIAMYLSDLFNKGRGKFSSQYNVYGFNRGIFLIYTLVDNEASIPELINKIIDNIFRIVKEKNLKVWVQPFFGIKRVENDENMTSAIEDAFIARNVSESNYEAYTFYSPSFKTEVTSDDINDIEEGLRNEEFVPYYQPKFSLKTNKFISVEALARWNSSKHGFLTPNMFIDKAENAGMISLIDNYIFERVVKDLSSQLRKGRRVLPVSINFSIYEFYSQGFIDNLLNLLNQYNVPTNLIEIEITETTSQANQFISISIIKKLRELGIRVLMDDFGIGYSGIDNLRKIPFDALKIDKSFADPILEDEKTRSIVKTIIELGHINNIEVIIEGVDNHKQVELLKKMKIDTIQGFYYSQGLSLENLDTFLRENPYEKKEEVK